MGGELINGGERNVEYKSGKWEDISIDRGMTYQEFSYVQPWMRYTQCNLMDFLTHPCATRVVQVHTFRNIHNQSIEDASFGQPIVRTKQGRCMVDDVIRGSPDYLSRQLFIDSSHMSGPYKGALFSAHHMMLMIVAYAHLECDYLVAMEMLRMFNPKLAKWVEDNQLKHWCMFALAKLGKCWESHVVMHVQQYVDWD
ncbi:hypothetical protein AAG906_021480 [Vitis piasezkii]